MTQALWQQVLWFCGHEGIVAAAVPVRLGLETVQGEFGQAASLQMCCWAELLEAQPHSTNCEYLRMWKSNFCAPYWLECFVQAEDVTMPVGDYANKFISSPLPPVKIWRAKAEVIVLRFADVPCRA